MVKEARGYQVVQALLDDLGLQETRLSFLFPAPVDSSYNLWQVKFVPAIDREISLEVVEGSKGRSGFWMQPTSELYVAKNGNDSWSGRLPEPNEEGTDGPFASLGRAQAELRIVGKEQLPAGGVTVWIGQGDYVLEESLRFSSADSGAPDKPIVYGGFWVYLGIYAPPDTVPPPLARFIVRSTGWKIKPTSFTRPAAAA